MKRSLRVAALSILVLSFALFFALAWRVSVTPTPSKADTTRTFTFVNHTSQTIWAGALANSGFTSPANGGWVMAPGSTFTVTVANNWQGRFWGRTYCSFDSTGRGTCETGDCGGVLQCNGAGGIPPASLAEFTLAGDSGKDFYDVSFVDGFNVPMTITPIGGATPIAGNPYWCGVAGCGTDLNTNCPGALRQTDAMGRTVACKSACEAFNTDQYCCRGAFNTAATCQPSNWPVNYASYFKQGCPNAYSYAYDDPTSTFTDANANYQISFGPAGSSPGNPTPPPTATTSSSPPAPTPTAPPPPTSASAFTQGVNLPGDGTVKFWFQAESWQAGYVILHYQVAGNPQQNVNMTFNSSNSRWVDSVSGLSAGTTVTYSFTYQRSGLQYDTGWYTWP